MRSLTLMLLTLCVFSGSSHASAKAFTKIYNTKLRRIELTVEQAAELKSIGTWLEENINPADCPDREFYSVHDRSRQARLLGYQVVAVCPDAPAPRVLLIL